MGSGEGRRGRQDKTWKSDLILEGLKRDKLGTQRERGGGKIGVTREEVGGFGVKGYE